jgi:hypothetical protein
MYLRNTGIHIGLIGPILCLTYGLLARRSMVRSSETVVSAALYTVFIVQAYQTSQYVVPRGGIILGKWHSSFA